MISSITSRQLCAVWLCIPRRSTAGGTLGCCQHSAWHGWARYSRDVWAGRLMRARRDLWLQAFQRFDSTRMHGWSWGSQRACARWRCRPLLQTNLLRSRSTTTQHPPAKPSVRHARAQVCQMFEPHAKCPPAPLTLGGVQGRLARSHVWSD